MKLKEHYDALTQLLQDNPEAGELEIFTAIDDEGNGFNRVWYTPGLGLFDGDSFIPIAQIADPDVKPNAVCLN